MITRLTREYKTPNTIKWKLCKISMKEKNFFYFLQTEKISKGIMIHEQIKVLHALRNDMAIRLPSD